MSNQDTEAAQAYHESTKLSYINLRNKPPIYKSYDGLRVFPLPDDFPVPKTSTLDAVAGVNPGEVSAFDLGLLARCLFFSAGLVRKGVFPKAGEVRFRAAASAGGLYPIETYLVCKDIPGLEAGVYHFSPRDFALRQLRKGDYRGELHRATSEDSSVAGSPATLIFTSVFWRSAWKYRTRSYRYCFWDNGTILANLLATVSTEGLPARVIAGFVDDRVNSLLGVDGELEASLCMVPLGGEDDFRSDSSLLTIAPLSSESEPPPDDMIDYPEIRHMHTASMLDTAEKVVSWRGVLTAESQQSGAPSYCLENAEGSSGEVGKLGDVILGRGSTRRFAPDPISRSQFSAIIDHSTRGVPADFLGPGGTSLLDIYIIVNSVDGIPPGSYFFSRERRGIEQLQDRDLRMEAGHLCFEQALGADASVVVFFMANLERVFSRFGNRGYRAAQLEAGILGGKMYLCAHSLGLGASGLTFYDDDVTDFFSPHSQGKSPMFVVALGVTDKINRVRPFRSRVGVLLDALSRGAEGGSR